MKHVKRISIAVTLLALVLTVAGCSLDRQQSSDEGTGGGANQPLPAESGVIPATDCTVHVPTQAYVFDAPAFNSNRQTTLVGPLELPGLIRTEDNWFELAYPEGERGAWVNGSQINFGNDMENDTNCQNLPVVEMDVEECMATNVTSEVQTIYTDPSLQSYLGRFHPGNLLVVLELQSDVLQVWVGAFATEGWIDASIAGLSGDCD